MNIVTAPNFVLFSMFLYFIFSGEKSCMSLLLWKHLKAFFISEKIVEVTTDEQKETREPVKFEEKYLERLKSVEDKELTDDKLQSLKDSFVMENTPQGNVIMFWNNNRDTFEYYADHIIPYRFLEVVGRKYTIMNDCRRIFVDMYEEIETAKAKIQEDKRKKEELHEEATREYNSEEKKDDVPKKSVFAKMKSYNRDNNNIKSVISDPKKSIGMPKNSAINVKEDDDIILKERANRYSYQGRMTNFSFLKKVERTVVDKNYKLTFAEFKKMMGENKS